MKQTAVEWLKEQIECFGNKHELQMSWATLNYLFNQAKEMERQQIMNAVDYGTSDWGSYKDPEVYYNETYNNKTK
jgi:hypothetical protein